MCRKTHTATLTPAGLAVDGIEIRAAKIIVMARPSTKMATCPECGAVSGRIHSRYRRRLIDLPAHGRMVEINVETRRFRCVGTGCRRRVFVQRLGDAVALPSARRTVRMDGIVHRLGLALGGRPGHNLASRLAIPVSKDTLLRTVRRRAARPRAPLRAVGIDDWAWRKGCQYGTVICDLERRRIVALLPDRAERHQCRPAARSPQHRVHCPGSWRELRRRRVQGCAPSHTNRRSLAPLRKRQRELS